MSDRDDSPDSQKGFTNLSLRGFAVSEDDEDTPLSALWETQERDTGEDPCNEASESDSSEHCLRTKPVRKHMISMPGI